MITLATTPEAEAAAVRAMLLADMEAITTFTCVTRQHRLTRIVIRMHDELLAQTDPEEILATAYRFSRSVTMAARFVRTARGVQ